MSANEDFEKLVTELYGLSKGLDEKGNLAKFDQLANYLYMLFMGNFNLPLSSSEEKFIATLCSATAAGLEYWRGVGDAVSRLVQALRAQGFGQVPMVSPLTSSSINNPDISNAFEQSPSPENVAASFLD
jgi:hypothetical protein